MKRSIQICLILTCGLVTMAACRKKIDHQPGVTGAYDPIWTRVGELSDTPTEIASLEIFNGELYMGGTGYSFSWTITPRSLCKLDENGVITEISNPNLMPISTNSWEQRMIFDLQVYENELFVGGLFKFNNQGVLNYSFFKLDVNDNPISMGITNVEQVKGLYLMNNSLIIFGSIGGVVVQKYSNGTMTPFAVNPPIQARGAGVKGNEIVLVRSSQSMARTSESVPWTSYQMNLSIPLSSDDVYSFVKFGDAEYYFLENSRLVKHYLPTNVWSQMVLPNSAYWGGNIDVKIPPKFKVLDGELYLLGAGIHKLIGNQWERIGTLNLDVLDIAKYNGKFYAGTNYGLFVAP